MLTEHAQSRRHVVLVLLGLLLPCVLITVPAVVAFRAEQKLSESFHWVTHTHEVQRRVQLALSALFEAESAQRGYLLTGHDTLFADFRAALRAYPGEITALRDLTADSVMQQENLRQLAPLAKVKTDFMEQTVGLHQRGDPGAAVVLVNSNRGKIAMDAVRTVLDRMDDEEDRLLALRQGHLAERARFSTRVLLSLVALNVLFAASVVWFLRRVSRLRSLVTMCAWSRTVEYQGEWLSFEGYLMKRFNLATSHGISPAEAEKVFGGEKVPVDAK